MGVRNSMFFCLGWLLGAFPVLEFVRCAAYNLLIKHRPPVSLVSCPSSHLLPFPLGSLIAIFTGRSSRALQGAIVSTVTSAFPRGLLTCYCVACTHTIAYVYVKPPDPSPQTKPLDKGNCPTNEDDWNAGIGEGSSIAGCTHACAGCANVQHKVYETPPFCVSPPCTQCPNRVCAPKTLESCPSDGSKVTDVGGSTFTGCTPYCDGCDDEDTHFVKMERSSMYSCSTRSCAPKIYCPTEGKVASPPGVPVDTCYRVPFVILEIPKEPCHCQQGWAKSNIDIDTANTFSQCHICVKDETATTTTTTTTTVKKAVEICPADNGNDQLGTSCHQEPGILAAAKGCRCKPGWSKEAHPSLSSQNVPCFMCVLTPTKVTKSTTTIPSTIASTVTATTVYPEENVDCVEVQDDCTVACESSSNRNYKVLTEPAFFGRACRGPNDCQPGDGGCPTTSATSTTSTTNPNGPSPTSDATEVTAEAGIGVNIDADTSKGGKNDLGTVVALTVSVVLVVILAAILAMRSRRRQHQPPTEHVQHNQAYNGARAAAAALRNGANNGDGHAASAPIVHNSAYYENTLPGSIVFAVPMEATNDSETDAVHLAFQPTATQFAPPASNTNNAGSSSSSSNGASAQERVYDAAGVPVKTAALRPENDSALFRSVETAASAAATRKTPKASAPDVVRPPDQNNIYDKWGRNNNSAAQSSDDDDGGGGGGGGGTGTQQAASSGVGAGRRPMQQPIASGDGGAVVYNAGTNDEDDATYSTYAAPIARIEAEMYAQPIPKAQRTGNIGANSFDSSSNDNSEA